MPKEAINEAHPKVTCCHCQSQSKSNGLSSFPIPHYLKHPPHHHFYYSLHTIPHYLLGGAQIPLSHIFPTPIVLSSGYLVPWAPLTTSLHPSMKPTVFLI